MTPSDSGTTNSLAVVSGSATIYARVPHYIKDQLDEWAETHSMTLSSAVRHLLEVAFAGEWLDTRETPREARYRMALDIIGAKVCEFCEKGEQARIALGGDDVGKR
jgi:hypothetical protein